VAGGASIITIFKQAMTPAAGKSFFTKKTFLKGELFGLSTFYNSANILTMSWVYQNIFTYSFF